MRIVEAGRLDKNLGGLARHDEAYPMLIRACERRLGLSAIDGSCRIFESSFGFAEGRTLLFCTVGNIKIGTLSIT